MPALSERNLSWDIFWDRYRIDYDGWDTHTRNFPILKDYNLPQFDQTFSALLGDLQDRGMLDETLVVVLSEMGRTPKINPNGGRDHGTFCYAVYDRAGQPIPVAQGGQPIREILA